MSAALQAATPGPEAPPAVALETLAVVLDAPGRIASRSLTLETPGAADVVVDVRWSGISTGTERLLYQGTMPPFPGLAYPLVPGYESVGQVVQAGIDAVHRPGTWVFVPGARCFREAAGLFGGAAARLVVNHSRVVPVPAELGERATLLALAATAAHILALAVPGGGPLLIVGHGALGRLLARLAGLPGVDGRTPAFEPVVWETRAARRQGDHAYPVMHPDADHRTDYANVVDASGAANIVDVLLSRLRPGGLVVLGGFYAEPVSFAYPPAFLREARLQVAAQWQQADLLRVARLAARGVLDLEGIISHRMPAAGAALAYQTAFDDPACLKMILDWSQP